MKTAKVPLLLMVFGVLSGCDSSFANGRTIKAIEHTSSGGEKTRYEIIESDDTTMVRTQHDE